MRSGFPFNVIPAKAGTHEHLIWPFFAGFVFMGSGLIAEPVLGPRMARTRGRCPGMTYETRVVSR